MKRYQSMLYTLYRCYRRISLFIPRCEYFKNPCTYREIAQHINHHREQYQDRFRTVLILRCRR